MGRRYLGSTALRLGRGTDGGRVFAAARAAGQSSRARLADLLIAATAAANGLPLYTRNPSDFSALKSILKVVKV
jgi:predicted nucleic acid-binding protein